MGSERVGIEKVREALLAEGGSAVRAAERLCVTRMTLFRVLRRNGALGLVREGKSRARARFRLPSAREYAAAALKVRAERCIR